MMFSSNIEIVREEYWSTPSTDRDHDFDSLLLTVLAVCGGKLILRIGTVFGSAVADTVDRFKSQVFDGFNLHIYVGIERTILAVVIAIHHHVSIRDYHQFTFQSEFTVEL